MMISNTMIMSMFALGLDGANPNLLKLTLSVFPMKKPQMALNETR
jgi:hypothetical protein